jgi:hypothetical protein
MASSTIFSFNELGADILIGLPFAGKTTMYTRLEGSLL